MVLEDVAILLVDGRIGPIAELLPVLEAVVKAAAGDLGRCRRIDVSRENAASIAALRLSTDGLVASAAASASVA